MGNPIQQLVSLNPLSPQNRASLPRLLLGMLLVLNLGNPVSGQSPPEMLAFEVGVWAKVAERTCIRCHHLQGEAKDSEFLLEASIDGLYDPDALARNQSAMRKVATKISGRESILLQKAVGGLEHGGGQILKPDSIGFRILERFVAQVLEPTDPATSEDARGSYEQAPFFDVERALEGQFEARISDARLPRVERSQSMLYAAQTNSKVLRRVVPFLPKDPAKERLAQQNDIALAAFKAGVCISANLSIGQFDSHNNNDADQMKLIPEFLAGIDDLLCKAEALEIRDKLVVIIQSEMGRTPNYNNGNGKDHWSISSIMFLGPGIGGNRLIGATDEKQQLVPIDPQTLKIDPVEGIRVRPEHIHQSLREFARIENHPLSQRFPLQVPEKEKLRALIGNG